MVTHNLNFIQPSLVRMYVEAYEMSLNEVIIEVSAYGRRLKGLHNYILYYELFSLLSVFQAKRLTEAEREGKTLSWKCKKRQSSYFLYKN